MKVELVLNVSGDYLDLNLFCNKHSASRLARRKPPFAASGLHQLLIGLFSPADETCITERNDSKESRRRRGGGTAGARWEKSLDITLIIPVNTGDWGSWANPSVDFSFHVWL